MASKRITLGRIGGPYGIKGWVKLLSYTDPRDNILGYSKVEAVIDRQQTMSLEMDAGRIHGKGLIAHFVGFDSPESAQRLNGAELVVGEDALPALDDGDYYWHQLTGLQVQNRDGLVLGVISNMLETGANDVMVIAASADSIDDKERLVPWLPDRTVLQVDISGGKVLVDWEPDYLE